MSGDFVSFDEASDINPVLFELWTRRVPASSLLSSASTKALNQNLLIDLSRKRERDGRFKQDPQLTRADRRRVER